MKTRGAYWLGLLTLPLCCPGQGRSMMADGSYPCRVDSLVQVFVRELRGFGVDSLIVITDKTDSTRALESSATHVYWLKAGTGFGKTFSGCDEVTEGMVTDRYLNQAFAFYQDNKVYSITNTRPAHRNADCGNACRCSYVTLVIPGEFRSFLVRSCDPGHAVSPDLESNAGIGPDDAGKLLQEWTAILLRH